MPWRMIIDQANAAAESNGRFFNKTNQFESIRSKRIGESRIGMLKYAVWTVRYPSLLACVLYCQCCTFILLFYYSTSFY